MWVLLGGKPRPDGLPPLPELSLTLTKPPAPGMCVGGSRRGSALRQGEMGTGTP